MRYGARFRREVDMINHLADLEHVEVVHPDVLVTAPDFAFRLHSASPAVELIGGDTRNRLSHGITVMAAQEQPRTIRR